MLSRRVFMKNGGLALLSLGFAPAFLERTVEAAAARRGAILITIFQRGAVDGLNMVVPFGERDYYTARPSIAIPKPGRADGAVDLDGFFGLHPRLAPLKPLWDSKQLAIVHASGSPDGTRSHFDAQDYMEIGHPRREEHAGRLAESLPARARTCRRDAVPRRRAQRPVAARAAGYRARARDRADRPVRHSRRSGDRHDADVVRIASTRRPPTRC